MNAYGVKAVSHASAVRVRSVAVIAALGAIALVAPAAASACAVSESSHCYAVTEWNMFGSPAQLIGTKDEVEIFYGTVPWWEHGDFLDNEEWVTFPQRSLSSWVEAGATIGPPYSGSEPRYFVARSYGPHEYWEYVWPSAGPGFYNWFGFYLDEPYGANGDWCLTWNWDKAPDNCFSGFPTVTKNVEAGLEFATSASSGANNNGRSFAWQQWTNGAWYRSWESAWNHAVPYREAPLCENVPAPGYGSGSIAFAVPGC